MKTKPTALDESGRGFDSKKFWRHYVATVDTNQEWSEERPQPGRGSNRLFLFLLLFHIFLIASVVLFNLVAERPKPVFVDNSIPASKTAKGGASTPAGKAGAGAGAQQETVSHTVTEADTLKSIAATAGVSQEEIAKMNNIGVDTRLAVGSVLRVPKPKAKPAVAIIATPVQPARVPDKVLTVKPEVETSMFAAAIPTTALKKVEPTPPPKQEVVAKKLPEEKPKAKVEDSLPPAPKPKALAKVEDSPPAAKAKPPVKSEDTSPSAKVKPTESKALVRNETPAKNDEPSKPAAAKSTATAKAASAASHTVKPKETFYSISRKYHVNVNELMKMNGFSDPAKLREGVVLKVPK
jgi:LysM repeat protein